MHNCPKPSNEDWGKFANLHINSLIHVKSDKLNEICEKKNAFFHC